MIEKALILIVDDVPSNVQMLANLLKDDYQVKVAVDGKRAVELAISSPKPDLILLDVEMPNMDGYEVCSVLKENQNSVDIPIIFVTGHDSIAEEEKGFALGARDYITKPFRPAIVKARVNTQIELKQQRDELIRLAMHDQLTGLYNRHYLTDEGGRKFARAKRREEPLCAILIDIDHFKAVNDVHGHLMGDKILQAIAKELEFGNREEDFTARYGGEEFIILLENCNLEFALKKAEMIRNQIEKAKPEGLQVTASFGVSSLGVNITQFETLLKRADDALYEAKESGRNKVVAYT
jgi:diguanylate cyclase (GGDEF)-like protein